MGAYHTWGLSRERPDSQLSGYRTDKEKNFQSVNLKQLLVGRRQAPSRPKTLHSPLLLPLPKKKQAKRKPQANPGMGMILSLQLSTF